MGLSQKPGTDPERWDCPKGPESQNHGGYFSISETQKPGTVTELWDCPRSPEQSLAAPILRILRLSVGPSKIQWTKILKILCTLHSKQYIFRCFYNGFFCIESMLAFGGADSKSYRLDAENSQTSNNVLFTVQCAMCIIFLRLFLFIEFLGWIRVWWILA